MIDIQQRRIGTATVTEGPNGQVTISVTIDGGALASGEYGLFLYETGICDPTGDVPFSSAGAFDPDGPADAIGTLAVEGAEPASVAITTDAVALDALNDRDGTALIVRARRPASEGVLADTMERVACGVVYPPAEIAAAAATPVGATPVGATPVGAATPAGGATSAAGAAEDTLEMVDIDFNPNEFTIPANTDVTIHLPNNGQILHNLSIDDHNNPDVPNLGVDVDVEAGQSEDVTINAPAGDYYFYCNVPGHEAAGMFGTMHVE
jgi:nitrite reductase (NO-forming)